MYKTRRSVLQAVAATLASAATRRTSALAGVPEPPLEEFAYHQVSVTGDLQRAQQQNVTEVILALNEDSLLKPFREMSGKLGPGISLGGWYEWKPDYNHHHDDAGLAPGATFGQWTSALARLYAASTYAGAPGNSALRDLVLRLHSRLAESIGPGYFAQTRFPAYSFDKLVCGLMDAHRLLADPTAFATLDQITAVAAPSLPGHAVDREFQWKPGKDISWMWDESYTLPENLYLVSALGAGPRYRRMAEAYLDDQTYFAPLARGEDVLADKQAYSYVNALCSAMQAYLTGGSQMHLKAAQNGFALLEQQSFATGGWGPDELLRKPGYDQLAQSLTVTHNHFETPCGSYAHLKLTRYLLRATRDGHYGDSMEAVLHNTVLGSLPLQPDGRSFYNADYNTIGRRVYSVHRWPCCSGTLPQVVADYGINTALRGPQSIWIILYQPSSIRIDLPNTIATLDQHSGNDYLEQGIARLTLHLSRPAAFTLQLRIPEWAGPAASLELNGRPFPLRPAHGFAPITREWHEGDTLTLAVAPQLRLQPLPSDPAAKAPPPVALMWGPLVLFALRDPAETGALNFPADALLSARRAGPMEWTVKTPSGPRRFVPFTQVGDQPYSTYVTLT